MAERAAPAVLHEAADGIRRQAFDRPELRSALPSEPIVGLRNGPAGARGVRAPLEQREPPWPRR